MVLGSLVALAACDDKALNDAKKPPAGLTRAQAAAVLARVGDKTITVGDFATALERLDDVTRYRFQTPQKRKELLQEMIDGELLAQEAKRRGLDKDPAVQEATRQILREAMLAKARENMPAPADISAADIAAYYQKHIEEYQEPERRRVSAIVLADAAKADEVLAAVKKMQKPSEWGDLYFQSSVDAPKERDPQAPADLAGDLGLIGPPGDKRGRNEHIPEAVQKAAYELANVGDVYAKAVKAGDRHYLVRLTGMTKGHTRALAEADRSIRIAILQETLHERELKLEQELRQKFAVKVDEQALSSVELPSGAADLFGPEPAASAHP